MKSYSDNKVLQVLAAIGDLMVLNLLWILCCLPVVLPVHPPPHCIIPC